MIWVCSFLGGQTCLPPITYPSVFDSWLECSKTAHLESIELMDSFDPDFVNEYEVGMKYNCKRVAVY